MYYVDLLLDQSVRLFNRLDYQQWSLVFAGLIVVALLTLRGFGSRTTY
jgi:hypothetical protein